MWNKLSKLLFEEDIQENEEEVVVKQEKKPEPKIQKVEVEKKEVQPVEKKEKSLNIVVDDVQEKQLKPQVVAKKPKVVPISKIENKVPYEFTPVISPIFGVTDKDGNNVSITSINKKSSLSETKSGNVLSPIYGLKPTQEKIKPVEEVHAPVEHEENQVSETQDAQFSLDDFLENRSSNGNSGKTSFFKSSEIDELDQTTVFSNHNMTLFGDDDDDSENE